MARDLVPFLFCGLCLSGAISCGPDGSSGDGDGDSGGSGGNSMLGSGGGSGGGSSGGESGLTTGGSGGSGFLTDDFDFSVNVLLMGESSAFGASERFVPAASCTKTTTGSCEVVSCPPGNSFEDFVGISAGDLTLSSTGTGAGTNVVLKPTNNLYAGKATGWDSMPTDAPLQISATGAGIPAFTQEATFPQRVTFSSLPASASKTADLVLSWTGGSAETRVRVSWSEASDERWFTCDFDSTLGTGTVPQSVLGQANASESLTIRTMCAPLFEAGEHVVRFAMTADHPSIAIVD